MRPLIPYTAVFLILLVLPISGNLWSQAAAPGGGDTPDTMEASLSITSIPDSSFVDINGRTSTSVTPLTLRLSPGDYQLDVVKDGFEPLTYHLNLLAGQRISAQFILRFAPPLPIPVDSLDLFYIPEKPLLDINDAERMSQSFKRMAETFAIIPMGQGIIARILLGSDNRKEADILIIAGAVLSGGSLILGKVLSGRKRRSIEKANEQIAQDNILSQQHNQEIDRQLKEKNDEALEFWMLENEDRGRVIIESP